MKSLAEAGRKQLTTTSRELAIVRQELAANRKRQAALVKQAKIKEAEIASFKKRLK